MVDGLLTGRRGAGHHNLRGKMNGGRTEHIKSESWDFGPRVFDLARAIFHE